MFRDGASHGFRPRHTFPVTPGIKCFDLGVGEIDNRAHASSYHVIR
jgi:hypothetical protein